MPGRNRNSLTYYGFLQGFYWPDIVGFPRPPTLWHSGEDSWTFTFVVPKVGTGKQNVSTILINP